MAALQNKTHIAASDTRLKFVVVVLIVWPLFFRILVSILTGYVSIKVLLHINKLVSDLPVGRPTFWPD
jgi:hypothetical protein